MLTCARVLRDYWIKVPADVFLITGEFCYYDGEVSVRRAKITTGLRKKIKITTVKTRTSSTSDPDPAVGPNKQQPLGHRQYKDIRV